MNGTSTLLSTIRKYLATRYQEELGQQLTDWLEPSATQAAWRIVSAIDLRSPAATTSNAQAGALLDAELGLVLFLIPFAKGDDLHAQVLGASVGRLQSALQAGASRDVLPAETRKFELSSNQYSLLLDQPIDPRAIPLEKSQHGKSTDSGIWCDCARSHRQCVHERSSAAIPHS